MHLVTYFRPLSNYVLAVGLGLVEDLLGTVLEREDPVQRIWKYPDSSYLGDPEQPQNM
jgi:hypothetical protein